MFTKTEYFELRDFQIERGLAEFNEDFLSLKPNRAEPVGSEESSLVIRYDDTASGFRWGQDDYLILECEGTLRSKLSIRAEFLQDGKTAVTLAYYMINNRRVYCCFHLKDMDSSHFFLQTLPGHLKGHVFGDPTSIDSCNGIRISIENGLDLREWKLYRAYITHSVPALTISGEPLVDALGQCKAEEWTEKFHSEAEMVAFLQAELEKAKQSSGYSNSDWDTFGGWKKKHFGAKGKFYLAEENGRKWLVTPEGNAFFSNGVCYGSRMGVHGFVDGIETMFDWLPEKDDPVFRPAWTTADMIPEFVKRNGAEAGKGRYMYNFARSNMIRAFGTENWWDAWVTLNSARLKEWGFNTISVCVNNYLDEDVERYLKQARIPYCITLKKFPKTKHLIFRDFPDVFDEEYQTLSAEFAKQIQPFAGDPYFIGYFINNEPEWLFQRETNPAERLLAYPEKIASKMRLIEFLQERYVTVEQLNRAWNQNFSSFEDLYIPMEHADSFSETARNDLEAFRNVLIERYSGVPSAELTRVAPNAINLGMRYSSMTEKDFAGAEIFDVFSFNCYKRNPQEAFDLALRCTERPFIVGEWHYGASDSGFMSNALIGTSTQAERGKACAAYLTKALKNPHCVGSHYFEFNDQPYLGRFDGENMQIGLITVCNRPYAPCVDAFRAINEKMYEIITGEEDGYTGSWEYHSRF